MTGESDPSQLPPTGPAGPPPYPGGYPPPPPMPYGPYPSAPTGPRNGLGVAALVTAIVGLLLVWSVVPGFVVGIVAVVMGFLARGRCKRGEADNNAVATAGVALGIVAVVLSMAFIVIWSTLGMHWFNEVGGGDYVSCLQKAGQDKTAQEQCQDEFEKHLEDKLSVTPTPTPAR